MLNAFFHVQQISAADQIVKLANAQLRHDVTHFFSDEEEIVDHMLWLAGEFFTQLRVLCCHTHWAGIQVAFAHHDAAFHHQGCCGKAKFIRTQKCANRHVATGFHLPIGLHTNAATQAVQHQRLLCFGQANFPWAAAMFDGRPWRCACATIVPRNYHMVSLALGHTCGNCAHTHFGHQFHTDVSMRCHVFQVVNQLRQVFNRINIVVRWWRNQAHTGHRVA